MLGTRVRSCVLKGSLFSGDLGANGMADNVVQSCIQTYYTTPPDADKKRRRALAA